MNDIAEKQMQPRVIDLLRAQKVIYRGVKRRQGALLCLSIALPLLSLWLATKHATAIPYIALAALLVSYLEVFHFERWMRERIKLAARVQEEVDTRVLGINWNAFLVGSHVDPETVAEESSKKLSKKDHEDLLDWYSNNVKALPLHLARLICQRMNIRYDEKLRRNYMRTLVLVAVGVHVFVIGRAWMLDSSIEALFLTALAPLSPLAIWALKERNRQEATCENLQRMNEEVTALVAGPSSELSEPNLNKRSRELQDAIYNHRCTSPLIFDWFYNLRRGELEVNMHTATKMLADDLSERLRRAEA